MYAVAMIDPPWPKKKGGLRKLRPNQDRDLAYCTASVPEIFALLDAEVFPQIAPNGAVFMWLVDEFLHDGEQQMAQRGYKRHARIVWDKENGVAPAFTVRYTTEYLVWFYRSPMLPIAREMRGKFTTVLRERGRQHSRKPEAGYRLVEALYPDVQRYDVFSREPRAGWDQFGDQPDHFKEG